MPNTSATGGYLAPADLSRPVEDDGLEDQLQAMVAGITGLDGSLVRPRWQPDLPDQPEPGTNWCAVGITDTAPDDNAAVIHHSDGDGYDTLRRHETITAMVSFYGPNHQSIAARFRDGLSIAQNREAMGLQGFGFLDVSALVMAPDLVNQQWVRRADVTWRLRRQVDRTYPVLNLLEAVGTIHADGGKPDLPEPFDSANAAP